MKRILAWVLLFVMVLGMFAGCKKEEQAPTTTAPVVDEEAITAYDAMEYLKALYPATEEAIKTPRDYDRMGIVRIGGIPFTVVWTTDLPEDQIKAVVGEDGNVVMDVNEECEADTPYVLTATITDEYGNVATNSWNCILPQKVDMVAIVKAAYALKNGESLPYECTLVGKLTSIDTAWNPEYQNITVTMAVEGAEDMPIKCYRLKGEGADKLQVGNIITVTGTIKNYQGTIEFDAGCILDKVEKGDAQDILTDVGDILKAAYALKPGKSLGYSVELTGVVTEIDNPYDPAFKNISVVIVMEGYKKYPILCYRLKGSDVENIALKDTITVVGLLKNYKGTIEFDAGCQMIKRVSGGGVAEKPSSDENKILRDAAKLKPGQKLNYRATLTGEVVSVDTPYDSGYKNVTVTMKVRGTKFQCYRMKGDDASKVRVTDKITVTGIIENYYGKLEFGSGCTLDKWVKGSRVVPIDFGPVEENKAYRMEMKLPPLGKNVYFNGKISNSHYLQTGTFEQGVDVFAERTEKKGVRFYFLKDEVKTYIEIKMVKMTDGAKKARPQLSTEPTVYWSYMEEAGVYTVDIDGTKYYLGTYTNSSGQTYETASCSSVYYITDANAPNRGKTQFYFEFVTSPSDAPEGSEPDVPTDTVATLVDAPVAGVAYKFGMVQKNLENKLFFINGAIKGYYMDTTEDGAAAADVYLEETTGGYYLYAMVGGAKKYINMVVSGTHVNGAFENTAKTVYTYDTAAKTVIATIDGASYWFGTRNDNSFTTVGPVKTEYNGFYCQFYTVAEGGETPDVPDVPDEPDVPTAPTATLVETPVVGTAYKFGMVQQNVDNKLFFINGAMSSYYMDTTEDAAAAVDVYLEETEGGYYLYAMVGGAKKYINMVVNDTHVNGVFEDAAATVYTYDTEAKTVIATVNDAPYWFGTRNDKTYTTVGPVKTEYNGFYCQFYTVTEGGETPDVPDEPDVPTASTATLVETPVVGTAYKFGMVQQNVDNKLFFINGAMSSYYMDTTEDAAAAVDVYLEETEGGYYLYAMVGGAKKYINMVVNDTHVNGVFEDAAATVYTYDTEAKTVIATVNDAPYWFGTRNDKTYTTVGPVKTEYNGFYCQFYTVTLGETPEQPETPDVPADPAYATAPETGKAYKLGFKQLAKAGNIYYFTGTMSGYYGATDTDITKAVDMYLEAANGGYYLYFNKDAAKQYINIVPSGTHINFTFGDTASSVFTFDEEVDALCTTVNDTVYYMGNNGTYVNVGTIAQSNIANETYYAARLYISDGQTAPETPETPDTPETPEIPDEPQTPPAEGSYAKVTSADELTTGKYVMIVNTGYAPGVLDGTWVSAVQPVVSGNAVTDAKGGVWALAFDGNSVTITDANGVTISPKGGNNNGIMAGAYQWAWEFADGRITFSGVGEDTVQLASNTDAQYGNKFRAYKTSTVGGYPDKYPFQFTLYKLVEA